MIRVLTTALFILSFLLSHSQALVYPTSANIVDVTKPPYNADNTGVVDASTAINQAMIDFNDSHAIIYLPEGIYRISNRVEWGSPPGCEAGSTFTCHRYTILAGAGEDKTIMKLDDNHPDYQDANNPNFMILTFSSAAMSFENAVRNLTINIGSGNPGTHALGFEANNQGGIQNVRIISEDGQGQIGLHTGVGDQAGPMLIRDLSVDGFDWGVYTFANQNSIYFERLTLLNQNEYGFYNKQQSIAIKDLYFEGECTAIYNHKDGGSIVTLINSELKGIGDATTKIGFLNNNRREIFLRNVLISGYNHALQQFQNGFSLEVLPNGLIDEYTTHPPDRICNTILKSLNLPIKDTPKINYEDTSNWVSVMDYGAQLDNGFQGKGSSQDDSQAFQDAFNSGAATILVPGPQAPFPIRFIAYDTITIPPTVKHIIGAKGIISSPVHFKIEEGTDTLIIEDFAQFQNIIHHSARPLILKNLGIRAYESLPNGGSGDVFIEDVVGGPYQFNFQNVWARQMNTEQGDTNIINNGGSLFIFGMKTEKKGTAVYSRNGAQTEVLGTLFYGTTPDNPTASPIFIVEDSDFSVAGFKELTYISDAWDIKVQETRNGETRNYTLDNSVIRSDLFVAYVSNDGVNLSPEADAGDDQIIIRPQDSTFLDAGFNDDGLPSGNCFATIFWDQLSGPSSLDIVNADTAYTQINFSESGRYVIELEVSDGLLKTKDTVTINVFDQFVTTLDHNQDGSPSGNGAD
ncbi:MAG: glycosyl hydrolase family 28-related protein, partial [Bacteroidota bacterium]